MTITAEAGMYLALKLIHVSAAIVFLGNITTGLFWKAHADRTRDVRLIAHALEGVIAADRVFTIPGVILILIGGLGAASVGHLRVLATGWLLWSIVLFSISGIAFMARLVPLQRQMAKLARAGERSDSFDWKLYETLSRQWDLWGAIALLTPAVAAALMVLKPRLPGL